MKVGDILLCVDNTDVPTLYTKGKVYAVTQATSAAGIIRIQDEYDEGCFFSAATFEHMSIDFVPLKDLSEKEQFTYHMTGKLPDKYCK